MSLRCRSDGGGSSSDMNGGVGFQIEDVNITIRNQPPQQLAKVARLGNGPHILPLIMTMNPHNQEQRHKQQHHASRSTNYHISNMALMSTSQPQQQYAQNYPQQQPQLDMREAWIGNQQYCADQHQRQLHHLKQQQQQQQQQDEGKQLRFLLQQQNHEQDDTSILQNWQKQKPPQQKLMPLAMELHQQEIIIDLEQLVQQKRALEIQQQKVQMKEARKKEQFMKQKHALEVVQQKIQHRKSQIGKDRKCQERKFQKQQPQLLCATKVGGVTENLVAPTLPILCMPMHASPRFPTNVRLSHPRVPELPKAWVETPTIHASPKLPTNVGLSSPPRDSILRLYPPPSPCAPGDVGLAWSSWIGLDKTDLLSCDEAKDTEDDGKHEMKGGEVQSLMKPHLNQVFVDDSSASTVEYLSYPELPRKDEIPLSFMSSSVHRDGDLPRHSTVALPPSLPHPSFHQSVVDWQRKLMVVEGEQFSTSTTMAAKKKLTNGHVREIKAVSVPKRSRSLTIAQPVAVSRRKKSLPVSVLDIMSCKETLSFDRVEAQRVSESFRSRLDLSDILSLSDDRTGYAAAETCLSNKKRSRSAGDVDANHIPHNVDINGFNYDDEFVDDLPNCISWNHNKKRYIDRDGLVILAAKVKDRYDASSSTLMAISNDRPPHKEGGRKICWFDLLRVAGPTLSLDTCEYVQKGKNAIANIKKGKLKNTDSHLSQSSPASTSTQSDRPTKKKTKEKMSTENQSFTKKKKKKTKKATSTLLSSSNLSSPSPQSFTLPTPRLQSGCETCVFKDGKKVFAPWFGKAGSSLRVYYYPAVIMSHKLVQMGELLGAVVFYDVRYDDDGDFKHDIQGSLVISRKKYLKHNLKPMLSVGDEVYAAWWADSRTMTSAPSWFPGVVKAYKDLGYGGRHGLIRLYDITYDDGDELKSIEDYLVMKKNDYLITNSKVAEDGSTFEPTWLGVRNKVDETSIDRWANEIGWYVATIDGQDQSFSYLTDALSAYDNFVVSCKGDHTKESDLNLPQEWAFPTPLGICAPVHVSGKHVDMCAVRDEHTIRRRNSDLDIDSQGSFDLRRTSKSKSKLANLPNQEGSKDHQMTRKTASSSTTMAINLSIHAPTYEEKITESASSSLDVRHKTDDSITLHSTQTLTSIDDPTQSTLTIIDDPSLTTDIISVLTSVSDQPTLHPTLNGRFLKYPAFPAKGLPPKWTVCKIPRNNTSDHQAFDSYYFSPKTLYRFRSTKEVKRYLSYLDKENGDEVKAIQMFHCERNESKSISDDSSQLTSSNKSRPRVVESIKPSKSKSYNTDTSDESNTPTTPTGYIKPIIKRGEKVYACWSGPNGDGKLFFPGRVWDVRDNGVSSEYGPVMMYDIVYDDGDSESNVHEIWVMKKEEWEMYHRKPEESWIGVTNVCFPTSEDLYANILGWFKLSSSTYVDTKNPHPPVYSSLGDALRAHDSHVIETKGQYNVTAKELNFPDDVQRNSVTRA